MASRAAPNPLESRTSDAIGEGEAPAAAAGRVSRSGRMLRKAAWIAISLALLAVLIYVSEPAKVASVLVVASPAPILLGVGLWFVELGIRAWRWNFLLHHIGIRVPFAKVLRAYAAGLFVSNLTPARSGDPIRSVFLKQETRTRFSVSLSSIVAERIADTIVLLALAAGSFWLLAPRVPHLAPWIAAGLALYGAVVVVVLYVLSSESRSNRIFTWFFRLFSFLPFVHKRADRVRYGVGNITTHFARYWAVKPLAIATLAAAAIWVIEGAIVFLAFSSVGLATDLPTMIAATAIVILLSVFTTLPGGIGLPEIVMALVFANLFGLALAGATAAVLLARMMSFGSAAVTGSVALGLGFHHRGEAKVSG